MRRTDAVLARLRIETKSMRGPQLAFTREEAAKLIGVSVRQLGEMLACGILVSCFVAGEPKIPASELRRLGVI